MRSSTFFSRPVTASDGARWLASYSATRVFDDGLPILLRVCAQARDDRLVAAVFTLSPDLPIRPPHQRMEEKQGLHHDLQQIRGRIPAGHVGQLVR